MRIHVFERSTVIKNVNFFLLFLIPKQYNIFTLILIIETLIYEIYLFEIIIKSGLLKSEDRPRFFIQ
jgi:hypothetical protein